MINQQNINSIYWSIKTNIETDTYTTDNERIDPFIALSKDSSRMAIGIPTYGNTGLKKHILSIYDLKTGTRLYHSASHHLYSADKNFGTIIFKNEKNPNNFMLKDLTKTTFNVLPHSKAIPSIIRGPQSTPPRRMTTLAPLPPTETKPAPSKPASPVQSTNKIAEPVTTPSISPAPQKTWWQRWIGW